MKRELKFRAWDGEKMHYNIVPWRWDFVIDLGWHKCDKSTGNGILGSGGKIGEFLVPGIAFKEIMQFTGLEDKKNDKEIYEGDIVKYEDRLWEVVFHYDRFDMKIKEEFVRSEDLLDDPGFTDWEKCEVIGNIYENPELLKD